MRHGLGDVILHDTDESGIVEPAIGNYVSQHQVRVKGAKIKYPNSEAESATREYGIGASVRLLQQDSQEHRQVQS